jgi:hypothetical protein
MSGTSMATPLTAGLLALIKSYHPTWPNELIIEQCLATADDIDGLNPNVANKIGYGRINAFRALNETNPGMQQKLRLSIIDNEATDQDADGIFEPGELIYLGMEIMNYSVGLDTTDVTYTLSTSSEDVTLVSDVAIVGVPSDNTIWADSAFQFIINPDIDSTKLIDFEIHASSSLPIPLDSIWTISVVVNQRGVLVYDGIGTGNAYSGEYIRDFLEDNFIEVFYTETFPPALVGFDAAFLSFGNYGSTLSNGTPISMEMTYAIADYLYEGGYVYEDCGSFFGSMAYFEYTNLPEMMELFSVDTVITPLEANNIDLLSGLNGSIAEGISFNGSTQSPSYYIDIMGPDINGIAMFEEDDYGVVSVQGEGSYGQRTICFSYAIAHLEDDSLGTRDELLANIAEFFGLITVDVEEPEERMGNLSMHVYPNPAQDLIHISYSIAEAAPTSIDIYNMQGKRFHSVLDKPMQGGEHTVQMNISELPPGIYMISIQNATAVLTRKIVRQ